MFVQIVVTCLCSKTYIEEIEIKNILIIKKYGFRKKTEISKSVAILAQAIGLGCDYLCLPQLDKCLAMSVAATHRRWVHKLQPWTWSSSSFAQKKCQPMTCCDRRPRRAGRRCRGRSLRAGRLQRHLRSSRRSSSSRSVRSEWSPWSTSNRTPP